MNANNTQNALPLAELAIFAAVAETNGFSAAALRLGVSKAMVSGSVSRLESRLGVQLLQRTTRRMSLTEAGTAVLPHAQQALSAARDAEQAARHLDAAPRGRLRVNAPMSFGLAHVAPALGAFARRYPEVQVDLVLDDRVLNLIEHGFDLALRVGSLADSSLIAQRLGHSQNILVAHPDYLAGAGKLKAPQDLREHSLLLYTLSPTGARWRMTRGAKTQVVSVRARLQANNSLALREAALQGLGVARIPRFLVAADLAQGQLLQVLPGWSLPDLAIHAVTASRQLPRKTRAFIEFFRERIGEPPYWERAVHR